jgi:uncharacterized protein
LQNQPFQFGFIDHSFLLLPEKAIYWHAEKTIIIADLHLGKAAHFRKQGLALPSEAILKDYLVLNLLISKYKPVKILILGDLFHSDANNEWDVLGEFIKKHNAISFELIFGNHDILSADKYNSIGLKNRGSLYELDNLIFTHHPLEIVAENTLNLSGHIHPGVRLQGIGRQSVTLPCFYKNKGNFILPAFGNLTGLHIIKQTKNSEIYGINGSKIFVL